MREKIFSSEFCAKYKKGEKDFTRKRVLSFGRVIVLMLSGTKLSLQNTLNKFFSVLGELFSVPSGSAYCQAKQKIKAEVFVELSESLCADFYALYGVEQQVKLWHGHRLIGGDGTYLNLPDAEELRQEFGVHENQHRKEQNQRVQALAVMLHDLLNDVAVASALRGSHSSEKSLLFELWGATEPGDVLVLDRNSADYTIIAKAKKEGREVVIRCPRQSFSVVNDFWQSTEKERLVWLPVSQSEQTQKFVREHALPEAVLVRLLKFRLPSGEEEVLLTTLCDVKKYLGQEFFKVYGMRWCDETYFDRIKNIFELERFSGHTVQSIKQDFYGVIFLANLESVLSGEVETGMQAAAAERENKTMPQVNHAVSYVALVGRVATLLADPNKSSKEVLKELKHLFRKSPTRQRKGRKYERKTLTHAQKLRYHRYSKRVIA